METLPDDDSESKTKRSYYWAFVPVLIVYTIFLVIWPLGNIEPLLPRKNFPFFLHSIGFWVLGGSVVAMLEKGTKMATVRDALCHALALFIAAALFSVVIGLCMGR